MKFASQLNHSFILLSMCWGLEIRRKQQKGILSSQRSQLARDCLVWGIRPVCGSATVGQSNKKKVLPVAARSTMCIFCIFLIKVLYARS